MTLIKYIEKIINEIYEIEPHKYDKSKIKIIIF